MKNFTLGLAFVVSIAVCSASEISELPEVLELNRIMQQKNKFESIKTHRLDSLKKCVKGRNRSSVEKFDDLLHMVEEYSVYDADSTLKYAYLLENVGRQMVYSFRVQAKIDLADALALKGMYIEALLEINSLKTCSIPIGLRIKWYDLNTRFYGTLSNNARNTFYQAYYSRLNKLYSDSLTALGALGGDRCLIEQAQLLRRQKKYVAASKILDSMLAKQKRKGELYGSTAYYLSRVKISLGDTVGAMRSLAEAAISDITHGVKKTSAIHLLALEMHRVGEVDLAYKYINQSLEDATAFGSQIRIYTVASSLDIINTAYRSMNRRTDEIQAIVFVLVIALLIFMCLYAWKIWKDRKLIVKLNNRLKINNDSKERYLRYFIVMCSIYINKLSKYKLVVRRKINAGQMDELLRKGNDAELTEDEQKQFYKKFDSAFIHVYPDFVDRFNTLLQSGEQIEPEEGKLNTELRIFALIRIGIRESATIANFLNLSISTIYTYRNKVKHRAINPATFESDLLAIS